MRFLKRTASIVLLVFITGTAIAGQPTPNHNDYLKELSEIQRESLASAIKNISNRNPETLMKVADMYRVGIGTAPDINEAFKYYNEASKLNYAPAQERIAYFYLSGEGVTENRQKGMEWLSRAAKNGSYAAMMQLAIRYKMGDGVKQSDEGYEHWKQRADSQLNTDNQKSSAIQSQIESQNKRQRKTMDDVIEEQKTLTNPNIKGREARDYGLENL